MKKLFIDCAISDLIHIPEEQGHHLFTVLRHAPESPFVVSNPSGESGIYRLLDPTNIEEATLVERLSKEEVTTKVVLIQSFLKGDKFEFILQKATELNVHHIYGVSTLHCVAKYDSKKLAAKESRWQKILLEASQQCGRSTIPGLTITSSFEDVLQTFGADENVLLLGAYEREDDTTIKDILQEQLQQSMYHTIAICIGPEGGFHPSEMERLTAMGGHIVSLGPTILRAETAAIASTSMIQYEVLE